MLTSGVASQDTSAKNVDRCFTRSTTSNSCMRSWCRSFAKSPQPRSLPWLTVLPDFARCAVLRSESYLRFGQKPDMSKDCAAKSLGSAPGQPSQQSDGRSAGRRAARRVAGSFHRQCTAYPETFPAEVAISLNALLMMDCSSARIPSTSLCESRLTRRRLTNAHNSAWPKGTKGLLLSRRIVRC